MKGVGCLEQPKTGFKCLDVGGRAGCRDEEGERERLRPIIYSSVYVPARVGADARY